jgi:cytochrome c oxidase accessory protein FixG
MSKEKKTESFRDSIATIDKEGHRVWLMPKKPKGKLFDLRKYSSYVYLIVFFTLPFIKINGNPFFLLNVLERKFILFSVVFWTQDFFIFGLGMLIFIVFIALFTVIFGRVFCGWACPQTIFMEMVFRRIEYWIDGDNNQQKALKLQPWNEEKIIKRTKKFIVFFSVSYLISNTFLSYIIGLDDVISLYTQPLRNNTGTFGAILLFTMVFFFVYWWFREQVCLIVCPYGRMQGVLLDKDSIVVAYDYERGEPRHHVKKNETKTKGDCIDCGLCVKVCPTGIDIRNGTQLECINCTACIDECNHVMQQVGYPENLIRFDSENGIRHKKQLKFTTRMKAYSVVLLVLLSIEVYLLATRSDFDITVQRAKGMLYQNQGLDSISNLYTVTFLNKTKDNLPIQLKIENTNANIKLVGKNISLKPEGLTDGEFFVILNKQAIKKRKSDIEIGVYANNKKIGTAKTSFLSHISRK